MAEIAQLRRCQNCIKGTVLPYYGVYECVNCGAEHTPDGKLIETRVPSKNEYKYKPKRKGG